MLAFFRAQWRWLLTIALVLFGVLLSTQAVSYLSSYLARRHLSQQQARAEGWRARQQAATTARYSDYRLDSLHLANQKEEMHRFLTKLKREDDSLTRLHPARLSLPAFHDLPRE